MILYATIMFLAAASFGVMAALIYQGRIDLIHDYHRTNVTDKKGYGQSFGKAMWIITGAMILSGVIALFGESVMDVAVVVLWVGLSVGVFAIVRVQRKYNGGVF